MPEFTCKFWQKAIFGQLCLDGKKIRVQALDTKREAGYERIVLTAIWFWIK